MRISTFCTVILFVILGCYFQDSAFAEVKKKVAKTKKTQTKSVEKYDETAFDLTRVALPLNYRGHDALKIYAELNKRKRITKNEFETTEQFNSRLANEQSKPILGKLTVDDIYSFMIQPEAKYDADNKLLHLYIDTTKNRKGNDFLTDIGITIIRSSTESNSIEKNAYGSTVEVKSTSYSNTNLNFANPFNQFEWTYKYEYYEGRTDRTNIPATMNNKKEDKIMLSLADLTPDIAKEYKDNLRILFVVKLNEPFISSGFFGTTATYNSPYSYYAQHQNIHCSAVEMWVYNFKSGAVLKKVKIPTTT